MTKFELFVLHIPFIGLIYMMVLMNYNHDPLNTVGMHPVPTYEQSIVPVWIQLLSIIGIITMALILNN